MKRVVINTPNAPAAIGTYSQANRIGNLVFFSGQIPLDPKTMQLQEGFEAQAHQVFKNLSAMCEASGGDLSNLVKVNVYLTDLNNFALLNEIMGQYFVEPYPARAAVQVSALPKDSLLEIEAVFAD